MKTIGLIGGMSWESTATYYRFINEAVKAKLGGLHSAKCILYSVDFAEIETLQRHARWEEAAQRLIAAGRSVEQAGAEILLLCTNTMHKLADTIQQALQVPLLHIADATAKRIQQAGIARIGLLGTRFTMEEDFYCGRLSRQFNLDTIIPMPGERKRVHRIIYDELCAGIIRPASKAGLIRIIIHLAKRGAEGVILGCTELGLLLGEEDSPVPLFDTTRIHALAAVAYALGA